MTKALWINFVVSILARERIFSLGLSYSFLKVKMQWPNEPVESGVPRSRRAVPGARLPQPGYVRPVFNFPLPLTPNVLLKVSSWGRKKIKI